jgi:hypothetical protein
MIIHWRNIVELKYVPKNDIPNAFFLIDVSEIKSSYEFGIIGYHDNLFCR